MDLTSASSLAIYLIAVKTRIAETTGKTELIVNAVPSGRLKNIQKIHPCKPRRITEDMMQSLIWRGLCL